MSSRSPRSDLRCRCFRSCLCSYLVIARVAIVVASKPRLLIPAVALVGGAALMQMSSWPLNYDLEAAEMDGLRAENRTDLNGIVHRFAGSAGGNRPVLIRTTNMSRRAPRSPAPGPAQAPERSRQGQPWGDQLAASGDRVTCDGWLTVETVAVADAWAQFTMPCKLERDGLMSLSVWSLGTLDLSFRQCPSTLGRVCIQMTPFPAPKPRSRKTPPD